MSRRGFWEGNDSFCFAAPPPHAELGGGGVRNPSQRVVANFWRGGIAVSFFRRIYIIVIFVAEMVPLFWQ